MEKYKAINDFLFHPDNYEIYENVKRRIASSYHNGLLRSIMIRQPAENMVGQSKKIINYLFYPTEKKLAPFKTQVFDMDIVFDPSKINTNEAITFEGDKYSIRGFYEENIENYTYQSYYSELMLRSFIYSFDNMDANRYFTKQSSAQFYSQQLSLYPDVNKVENSIIPVSIDMSDPLKHKIEYLKKILNENKDSRIIIFFDYGNKKKALQNVTSAVEKALREDAKIAKRLIVGEVNNKDKAIEQYDSTDASILLATDVGYTESANLQKGNVIVNFEVTPDPLSMDQRIGRVFRLGQESNVKIYSLANMHELEGYVLMYFTRIGLLTSNSGDATIIAGCNNESMVAVQCERCGKVMLMDKEEYEEAKRQDMLYCASTEECTTYNPKGTKMSEMAVFDFKCDTCGSVFARSIEGGYTCISSNNDTRGVMCNDGGTGVEGRKYYCRKICSIAHCQFFANPNMQGKCPALDAYRKNKNIEDIDLMTLCDNCTNPICPPKCQVGIGIESIKHCIACSYKTFCTPRQSIISFNENWEAECPKCKQQLNKKGRLKKITARTFESYIRGSWNFVQDGGESFCVNLLQEANKVAEIKTILEMDRLDDRR